MLNTEDRPPRTGDIVYYTNLGDKDGKYPPEQQAAIVTKVLDPLNGDVSLAIFYPTGHFFMPQVTFSQDYQRGHWSWPTKKGDPS